MDLECLYKQCLYGSSFDLRPPSIMLISDKAVTIVSERTYLLEENRALCSRTPSRAGLSAMPITNSHGVYDDLP